MSISLVLFDLDGTLTDSAPGITRSVAYALEKMGAEPLPPEGLLRFIGPPLKQSFRRYCGFDDARCEEAVRCYREYFTAGGMFENAVYPGVPEALAELRSAGLRLAVATSKPELYSRQITGRFGLTAYFEGVFGAAMDETRTDKAEVVRYALASLGASPAEALMVGDREHDVLGAKQAGLPCVGVLWGYGSREELTKAGAEALAETPEALAELIEAIRTSGPHFSAK